ncbi:MAG: hypothetical protein KA220_01285, partial [Phenylobacterium sp.]|nr:hypothetical protein [Phenylobacterium sp.]
MSLAEIAPKLAASDPPPERTPWFSMDKAGRKHPFPNIPPQTYEVPVLKVPTITGISYYVVSDPDGVKR